MLFVAIFVPFLVFSNTIAARPISGVIAPGRAVNGSLSGPAPAVVHPTRHLLTLSTLWEGNQRTLAHSRARQTEEGGTYLTRLCPPMLIPALFQMTPRSCSSDALITNTTPALYLMHQMAPSPRIIISPTVIPPANRARKSTAF